MAVARASPPRSLRESIVVQPSYQRGTSVRAVVNPCRLSERLEAGRADMRKGNEERREEGYKDRLIGGCYGQVLSEISEQRGNGGEY